MKRDDQSGSVRPRAGVWLVVWALLVALYDAIAGATRADELSAGLASATVAVIAMDAVRRRLAIDFDPRPGWIGKGIGVAARALKDVAVVLAAIARALLAARPARGRFIAVPFDPGGDDGRSEARRALVLAGASVAPNAYAIAIDPDARTLLFHQLVPTPRPPGVGDREWPL